MSHYATLKQIHQTLLAFNMSCTGNFIKFFKVYESYLTKDNGLLSL